MWLPRLPASQGNSPRLQVGQSLARAALADDIWRMRLSHRSTTVSERLIGLAVAAQDLDRLAGLDRGDHVDDRPENAGRVAGGRRARRRRFVHQAAQAGRFAGQDRHRSALRRRCSRHRPRGCPACSAASLSRNRVSKLSVPSTMHVDAVAPALDVRGVDIGHDRLDRRSAN